MYPTKDFIPQPWPSSQVNFEVLAPQVIRNFEFYTGRTSGRLYKFEVLITTFELVLKDAATLGKVKWNYLMVDEAHRLKNHESALYQARPGPLRNVFACTANMCALCG